MNVNELKRDKSSANVYLFKFNSRNFKKSCDICSKLTIKIPEDVINVFINDVINVITFSYLFLVFLLLHLNK